MYFKETCLFSRASVFLFLFLSLFLMENNVPAFAEEAVSLDLSANSVETTPVQVTAPTNTSTTSVEDKIVPVATEVKNDAPSVVSTDKPAVESNSPQTDKEKNIVPVLELQGGVNLGKEKTEVKKSRIEEWFEGEHASGDWFGLRTKLEDHGITVEGGMLTDSFMKMHGGITNSRPLRSIDMVYTGVAIDTEKAGLWKGGKFYTKFQSKNGYGLTRDFIGDFQVMDGYDFRRLSQLSEFWYEQELFKERLTFKIGKQDANDLFCTLSTGPNFINTSLAYFMPTIPLPSYPDQSLGIAATIKATDKMSFKSGWFDGRGQGGNSGFNTAFGGGTKSSVFIEQAEYNTSIKDHPGRYMAGYWLKTGEFENFNAPENDPGTFRNKQGFYAEIEQMVFKENKDPKDNQGLTLVGQFGWAPSDRSEVGKYFGGSLQYKGLIPKRDNDVVGIGSANAVFSRSLRDFDGRKGTESALEMFYKIQINKWLSLQPDMQFIFNPNGKERNAFAIGLRTVISF